jgi:hypothetical protein
MIVRSYSPSVALIYITNNDISITHINRYNNKIKILIKLLRSAIARGWTRAKAGQRSFAATPQCAKNGRSLLDSALAAR